MPAKAEAEPERPVCAGRTAAGTAPHPAGICTAAVCGSEHGHPHRLDPGGLVPEPDDLPGAAPAGASHRHVPVQQPVQQRHPAEHTFAAAVRLHPDPGGHADCAGHAPVRHHDPGMLCVCGVHRLTGKLPVFRLCRHPAGGVQLRRLCPQRLFRAVLSVGAEFSADRPAVPHMPPTGGRKAPFPCGSTAASCASSPCC